MGVVVGGASEDPDPVLLDVGLNSELLVVLIELRIPKVLGGLAVVVVVVVVDLGCSMVVVTIGGLMVGKNGLGLGLVVVVVVVVESMCPLLTNPPKSCLVLSGRRLMTVMSSPLMLSAGVLSVGMADRGMVLLSSESSNGTF